ncbi:MAG: glycosyltransferase family 4 protein [Candidatus Aenigmarchaeota archaeon]|nr:glycosyltransferase family 4 protein [Candidatus Aenigmarchaeota archaeon]
MVSTFPPYRGGMGNVCWEQANQLARLGHQVTVFTPRYRNQQNISIKTPFLIKRLKPVAYYGNAAILPQVIKTLAKFDVIHLHYPFFGAAEIIYLARLFGYRRKTPLILQYHMDVLGKDWKRLFFGWHNKFTLPRIICLADKVIASSLDYLQHSSIKQLVNKKPDKFISLPLGGNTELFHPKQDVKSTKPTILFVGGLDQPHYFKGVNILLSAFVQIKKKIVDSQLIIIGEGDLKQQYIALANQLGIRQQVTFAGSVSSEKLVDYYNSANLLVLPSIDRSEAFGLVLLEAMACAKPVIASNLPGVRTVVEEGKNGLLVRPGQVDDLAKKILIVLSDESLQKQYGNYGYQLVQQKYQWSVIAQQLERIYVETIKQKNNK